MFEMSKCQCTHILSGIQGFSSPHFPTKLSYYTCNPDEYYKNGVVHRDISLSGPKCNKSAADGIINILEL